MIRTASISPVFRRCSRLAALPLLGAWLTAMITSPGSAAAEAAGANAGTGHVAGPAPATMAAAVPPKRSPYRPTKMTEKAKLQYRAMWGVDRLRVSSTNAGNLIRFTYRVEEPALAKTLLDRNATPYLYSPKAQAMLQVPVMEKVGPLRQAMAPKAGQDYWMVFSNKGNLVKPGDRVDIRIGSFHADGLMVD